MSREFLRHTARFVLALFYFIAGIFHLTHTAGFMLIIPGWVPFKQEIVIFTGVCELFGAMGLMTHRFRIAAGIGLALYALCVFPANIYQALYGIQVPGIPDSWWYHGPRLLLQPFIIWITLFSVGLVGKTMSNRKSEN